MGQHFRAPRHTLVNREAVKYFFRKTADTVWTDPSRVR